MLIGCIENAVRVRLGVQCHPAHSTPIATNMVLGGKEKDNEIKGGGNSLDFGSRGLFNSAI